MDAKDNPTTPSGPSAGDLAAAFNNAATIMEWQREPLSQSVDDKHMIASIVAGAKEKKALDSRAHWNNKNTWFRYYDHELGVGDQDKTAWWHNDDAELATKHVVF